MTTEYSPEQAELTAKGAALDRLAGELPSLHVAEFDAAAKAIAVDGQTLDMKSQEPIQTAEPNINPDVVRSAIPVF